VGVGSFVCVCTRAHLRLRVWLVDWCVQHVHPHLFTCIACLFVCFDGALRMSNMLAFQTSGSEMHMHRQEECIAFTCFAHNHLRSLTYLVRESVEGCTAAQLLSYQSSVQLLINRVVQTGRKVHVYICAKVRALA